MTFMAPLPSDSYVKSRATEGARVEQVLIWEAARRPVMNSIGDVYCERALKLAYAKRARSL